MGEKFGSPYSSGLVSHCSGNIRAFILAEDVEESRRACIRVNNPPGGRSAGGFW